MKKNRLAIDKKLLFLTYVANFYACDSIRYVSVEIINIMLREAKIETGKVFLCTVLQSKSKGYEINLTKHNCEKKFGRKTICIVTITVKYC